MLRVALAEDSVLLRQGIEGVLASADDLTLVARRVISTPPCWQ
jgi:hypothetical protein